MPSKEEERLKELKKKVLSSLERASAEEDTPEVRNYSLPGLKEEFPDYSEKLLEKAVEELREEDWIEKHDVHVKIVVPTSEEGDDVLTAFAERGIISMSPYWAVFLAGLSTYAILHLYGMYSVGSGPPATSKLYKDAVVASAVLLPILGYGIQLAVARIRRLRLISEDFYLAMERHTKFILVSTVGLLAVYWWGASRFPYERTQAGFLAVVGIGLTLGGIVAQVLHSNRTRRSTSNP